MNLKTNLDAVVSVDVPGAYPAADYFIPKSFKTLSKIQSKIQSRTQTEIQCKIQSDKQSKIESKIQTKI